MVGIAIITGDLPIVVLAALEHELIINIGNHMLFVQFGRLKLHSASPCAIT